MSNNGWIKQINCEITNVLLNKKKTDFFVLWWVSMLNLKKSNNREKRFK